MLIYQYRMTENLKHADSFDQVNKSRNIQHLWEKLNELLTNEDETTYDSLNQKF